MIYLDKLKQLEDYMVHVVHDGCGSLSGILNTSPLSFDSSASYDANPINAAISEGGAALVQQGAQAIGGSAAGAAAGALMDASITHSSTVKTFRGAGGGEFSVAFKVIPNKFGMGGYASIEQTIKKLTQPKIVGNQLNSNLYTTSDAAAAIKDGGKVTALDGKLIKVSIGHWFETPSILYASSINRNYSQFMGSDGKPLYMDLSISFVPYRALLSEDPAWLK